jgi:hypothetical protein
MIPQSKAIYLTFWIMLRWLLKSSRIYAFKANIIRVDAYHYGNVSRFVNHSCEPNLIISKVFFTDHYKYKPRLALFTQCDVAANEEICFDYNYTVPKSRKTRKLLLESDLLADEILRCKCESEDCRQILWLKPGSEQKVLQAKKSRKEGDQSQPEGVQPKSKRLRNPH